MKNQRTEILKRYPMLIDRQAPYYPMSVLSHLISRFSAIPTEIPGSYFESKVGIQKTPRSPAQY